MKRSFRAKQMDVSLKYSALYHMCNYKVTVFSNTVLIQSFYIQKNSTIKNFQNENKATKNQHLSWLTTFAKEICCREEKGKSKRKDSRRWVESSNKENWTFVSRMGVRLFLVKYIDDNFI